MESGQPKSVDPRMHSAEHILSGTMVRLYGCGRPFTTHLEKKKSKVDIQFPRPLTQEELSDLERRVNEVIALDLPVWEELLDRPEAARRF
ncbi:MAG: Alanyl-tRNA synthetase, partial [Bacteroidetes bacterium]|nr:Alanyl-tRNA synthetase [Bacteroidota bacterium]